jgi:hypothetical protein
MLPQIMLSLCMLFIYGLCTAAVRISQYIVWMDWKGCGRACYWPFSTYCHNFRGVTIDGVWIGELDLLTNYISTNHSEMQVTTTLSLISTLQIITETGCITTLFYCCARYLATAAVYRVAD